MKIQVKSTVWDKIEADRLAFFVTEEGWKKQLEVVDKRLSGQLVPHLVHTQFKAKMGEKAIYPAGSVFKAKLIMIIGLGKTAELTLNSFRIASAVFVKSSKSQKHNKLAIDLTFTWTDKIQPEEVAQVVTEGAVLGSYKFNQYRTEEKKEPEIVQTLFILSNPSKLQHVSNGIKLGEIYADATVFSRDLINESPSVTTPRYLALQAKKLAKNGVKVEIFEEKALKKMEMGAYLAVSRGSDQAPKFIKLVYKGGNKKVILVGKGITFDTGGLSLKDSKSMETMKLDMSGAAAILGIFKALPLVKPNITVVGLIPACENMPGPASIKPGDVVTAHNGKTIEILNTDAEGRLTLADALSFGLDEKPDIMIDLATLTGACMVALGEEIAGLFTNDRKLNENLHIASEKAGEKYWQLPLEKEYKDLIKSDIADLRNIGKNRYAGAITAALFLEEFVNKTPWAHLDIAGPAFEEKETPVIPKGGAGFGVRTILNFLRNFQ